MSDKYNLVIQPNGEIIAPTPLGSEVIIFEEEKRQKLIQILRQFPAILEAAKKLSEGKTYKAYIAPETLQRIKDGSAKLINKENGLLSATIRDAKSGQIIDHADLMEVTPDLLSSLNQLAVQQTLANIIRRLEAIDEKITDVLQGQVNDRLAEVESGIHIYDQAMVASDPDTRRELLVSAIQKLNDGRNKLLKSTDLGFINKLPRTRLGMFFFPKRNIPDNVQSKADAVWKAAFAIVVASRYLVMAYSALNEPDSLRVSLEQVKNEVNGFRDKMEEIVRWLPPSENWRESLTFISQGILPNIRELDDIPQKNLVVEFQPNEIAPLQGV